MYCYIEFTRKDNMEDKIIEFIKEYCYLIDEAVEKYGKYKTISAALLQLIKVKIFTADELRKELSVYIKRIISISEFNQLLDYSRVEYAILFR